MDGFEFENCGNAVLKCEGKILGGVERATLLLIIMRLYTCY